MSTRKLGQQLYDVKGRKVGDAKAIADITGYSKAYVLQVIAGHRPDKHGFLPLLQSIVDHRNELTEQYEAIKNQED